MKRINRLVSLIVAMMLVMGTVGMQRVMGTEAASSKQFSVVGVKATKSPLQKGDKFGLYVEIRQAGKTPEEQIDIEFDKADFSGVSQIDTGTSTGHVSLPMAATDNQLYIGGLTYLGGDGNINFTIDGLPVNVKLKVEEVSDGEGTLKLKDKAQIAILAGETKKVEVEIENTGTATVKKPTISVSLGGEKVEGISLKNTADFKVSSIGSKSSARASFEIQTSKAVKAGNYQLEFNLAGKVEAISLRVTSDFSPPQLEFSIEGLEEIRPGVSQPIKIKVTNVGDSEAKQVKIELENKEEMAIVGGSNVKYIASIPAKQSAYANFAVRVAPSFTQNMLPVKINYDYQDEIGESLKDKVQYVYVPLKGDLVGATSGEIVVENIIGPAGAMGVGRNFNVKFTLAALKGTAKNVRISVSAEDPEAIVPNSQNLFMIPEVKKGTKKQYAVTMSATSSAGHQSHPIKIEVTYDSVKEGETITFKQYTSVNIHNPKVEEVVPKPEPDKEEETLKGQPKVIVGTYKITPTIVKAGEEFTLDIGFLNTNKLKSVHNLKASLTVKEQGENDAGNVFTPVNASNTFYISSLSPEQTISKSITMYTIPNALPKTYQVLLELEYEDSKGNAITATENIGIPVEQTTKVDIAEIEMDMATLGVPMPLNISLYNTGKTNISNLMVYTEGTGFTVQDNKMFVGTFEKGASEYYAPTIIPDMPGMLNGTIVVEYEEATGEIVQIRKDFEFEVMDAPEEFPDDMGEMPFPEDENKSKLPIVFALIALLGAGTVAAVIVHKKKRREEKEIEFDLDE